MRAQISAAPQVARATICGLFSHTQQTHVWARLCYLRDGTSSDRAENMVHGWHGGWDQSLSCSMLRAVPDPPTQHRAAINTLSLWKSHLSSPQHSVVHAKGKCSKKSFKSWPGDRVKCCEQNSNISASATTSNFKCLYHILLSLILGFILHIQTYL